MNRKLLSAETVELLEYRINQEEFSSRLYEYMSLWLENKGYFNTAKLYAKYSSEELTHAGWAKSYLLDYGYTPCLKALPSPETEYKSCGEILEATLTHELLIQKQCEEMAAKSLKSNQFVLHHLALRYCGEQAEEVGKAINLLDIHALTMDGLVLDHYVGKHLL